MKQAELPYPILLTPIRVRYSLNEAKMTKKSFAFRNVL